MARHGLSLIDIQKAFGTEDQCLAYLEAARWPEGVSCLRCGNDKVSTFKSNETTREIKNRKGEVKEVRVPARRRGPRAATTARGLRPPQISPRHLAHA